jgi:hypothetical protein
MDRMPVTRQSSQMQNVSTRTTYLAQAALMAVLVTLPFTVLAYWTGVSVSLATIAAVIAMLGPPAIALWLPSGRRETWRARIAAALLAIFVSSAVAGLAVLFYVASLDFSSMD